jgi:DNA-directed RNA polymerase specialized sigma24 family protein
MGSPTSAFTLIEKAKAGDEAALSRAFEKHRRRLAVLIHFKLRPHASDFSEVEDVVQVALPAHPEGGQSLRK